ncbi:hypothetical protein HHK36_010005 [Tetracentron sinense]|uniref:TF-B3 domain-containing protein n=1 Tax=Tetracentron sinense TaxID=13715 RepID=A0A835DLV9_TETSI|nr:hypothetical protein HHK36_010005 [Tetracentron sinense]
MSDLSFAKLKVKRGLKSIPRIIHLSFHSSTYPLEISVWEAELCENCRRWPDSIEVEYCRSWVVVEEDPGKIESPRGSLGLRNQAKPTISLSNSNPRQDFGGLGKGVVGEKHKGQASGQESEHGAGVMTGFKPYARDKSNESKIRGLQEATAIGFSLESPNPGSLNPAVENHKSRRRRKRERNKKRNVRRKKLKQTWKICVPGDRASALAPSATVGEKLLGPRRAEFAAGEWVSAASEVGLWECVEEDEDNHLSSSLPRGSLGNITDQAHPTVELSCDLSGLGPSRPAQLLDPSSDLGLGLSNQGPRIQVNPFISFGCVSPSSKPVDSIPRISLGRDEDITPVEGVIQDHPSEVEQEQGAAITDEFGLEEGSLVLRDVGVEQGSKQAVAVGNLGETSVRCETFRREVLVVRNVKEQPGQGASILSIKEHMEQGASVVSEWFQRGETSVAQKSVEEVLVQEIPFLLNQHVLETSSVVGKLTPLKGRLWDELSLDIDGEILGGKRQELQVLDHSGAIGAFFVHPACFEKVRVGLGAQIQGNIEEQRTPSTTSPLSASNGQGEDNSLIHLPMQGTYHCSNPTTPINLSKAEEVPCSSSVLLITFLYELNLSNLQGIPKKFVRKFGNTLSDVAFLKVPSGTIWCVGLRKADGEVWFQNSWQEFMEYHSIHDGHFLVFRYDGNSHFHVLIFDMSACEIEYPFDTKKFEEPKKEISEEDFVEILDASPPCQTRRDGAPLPRLWSHKNMRLSFATRYFKGLQNVTLRVLDGRTWSVWCTYGKTSAKICGGWKAFVRDNYLEEGDVCVFELIKRKHIELKVTIFRVRIPPAFIKHDNGVVSGKAILKDPLGRFWHVEVEKVQNDFFFKNGWQGYVKDHSLELGDFLIFRYNGNSLFDVKIFGRTGCEKEETLAYRNADMTSSYIKKEGQSEAMETFSKCTYGLKQKHSERGPIKIGKTISCIKKEEQPEAMGAFRKRTHGLKRKYSDGGPIGTSKENCGSTQSKRTAAITVEEDELFKTASVLETKNPHFTGSTLMFEIRLMEWEMGPLMIYEDVQMVVALQTTQGLVESPQRTQDLMVSPQGIQGLVVALQDIQELLEGSTRSSGAWGSSTRDSRVDGSNTRDSGADGSSARDSRVGGSSIWDSGACGSSTSDSGADGSSTKGVDLLAGLRE